MHKKLSTFQIKTCEMHTCGSPVRIIESIEPPIQYPEKSTVLEKRQFLTDNYDFIRQMTVFEPRGHRDMFIVFITDPNENSNSDFGLIFAYNQGFLLMCGHITIAVGRYLLEKKKITPVIPETEIQFDCPCGIIKVSVEWDGNRVGNTKFINVPAYVQYPNLEFFVPELQKLINIDIAYGGNSFALVSVNQLGIDFNNDPPSKFVDLGRSLLKAIKNKADILKSNNVVLAGLYIFDYNDTNDVTKVMCVYGRNSFDRCSCGSGTTACIANQYFKGNLKLNQKLLTRNPFVSDHCYFQGIPIEEATSQISGQEIKTVLVEISGRANFMGENILTCEEDDYLKFGFLV